MKKKILNFNYKRVVYCSERELWTTLSIITALWIAYSVGFSNLGAFFIISLLCFGMLAGAMVIKNAAAFNKYESQAVLEAYFSRTISNSIFSTLKKRDDFIFDENIDRELFYLFLNLKIKLPIDINAKTQFLSLLYIMENSIENGNVWVENILRLQRLKKEYYNKSRMKCIDKGESESKEYMSIIKDRSVSIEQKIDTFLSTSVVN
ncbi:MAG: hypothetical protein ACK5L5_08045 [Bacteroidales bacterium]